MRKINILEYGYVSYQIKGNKTYDNKQANSVPLYTPLTPGIGSKGYSYYFKAFYKKIIIERYVADQSQTLVHLKCKAISDELNL